ncbi:hypothetical protein PCC7418_1736 [Halothece sp. PCC 7418]|nr:hypothetical protein PCC7418_1736 [Halothece sp. PCC 7418]
MRVPSITSTLFVFGTIIMLSPASLAGQRLNGTVFFNSPPRLENARTTFNEAGVRGATYYFTFTLPSQAGEPLEKLVIDQRGGVDDIPLLLDRTIAFVGTSKEKQEPLLLADVSQSEDNRQITVQFQTPVTPGTTFTIGLKPRKNPIYDGTYLFGITAFPAGETVDELYLGVRRLQFYDRRNNSDFRDFL